MFVRTILKIPEIIPYWYRETHKEYSPHTLAVRIETMHIMHLSFENMFNLMLLFFPPQTLTIKKNGFDQDAIEKITIMFGRKRKSRPHFKKKRLLTTYIGIENWYRPKQKYKVDCICKFVTNRAVIVNVYFVVVDLK